jgi:hypothetical protein
MTRIEQNVRRFRISMNDSLTVRVSKSACQLLDPFYFCGNFDSPIAVPNYIGEWRPVDKLRGNKVLTIGCFAGVEDSNGFGCRNRAALFASEINRRILCFTSAEKCGTLAPPDGPALDRAPGTPRQNRSCRVFA